MKGQEIEEMRRGMAKEFCVERMRARGLGNLRCSHHEQHSLTSFTEARLSAFQIN